MFSSSDKEFVHVVSGRRLAALGGGPLRKLLGLLQEATTLVESCCESGESPLTNLAQSHVF